MKNPRGFTILELLVVLALLGTLAGVILPNLPTTLESDISGSVEDLSSQVYNTYIQALTTRQLKRVVLDGKTGSYWTEEAPKHFVGRPPTPYALNDPTQTNITKQAQALYQRWEEEEKRTAARPTPTGDEPPVAMRSLPVIQRDVLKTLWEPWHPSELPILAKKQLRGDVQFIQIIATGNESLNYKQGSSVPLTYIYFLPHGQATPCLLQIGILEDGIWKTPYTLTIDPPTGQLRVEAGFVSPQGEEA